MNHLHQSDKQQEPTEDNIVKTASCCRGERIKSKVISNTSLRQHNAPQRKVLAIRAPKPRNEWQAWLGSGAHGQFHGHDDHACRPNTPGVIISAGGTISTDRSKMSQIISLAIECVVRHSQQYLPPVTMLSNSICVNVKFN